MNNRQIILPVQVKKISIAIKQLGIDDDTFRQNLSRYLNKDGKPCTSRKELSRGQADAFLDAFRKAGWKETRKYKDGKYAQFAGRGAKYATVGQLEKIDAAWYNNPNVRVKTDEAMNSFIKRIAGVDKIEYVLKWDVKRVLKAIESIAEAGGRKSPPEADEPLAQEVGVE